MEPEHTPAPTPKDSKSPVLAQKRGISVGSPLEELTVKLLRARRAIVLSCLSIGLATFLVVYLFTDPIHTASLRFFITHDNALAPEKLLESGSEIFGNPGETDFHLLHLQSFGASTEVLLSVVDELDLVNHYGIDDPNDRLLAAEKLYKRLVIDITLNKELLVEISDRDMATALRAANIVMERINSMNNGHLIAKIGYMEQVSEEQLLFYKAKRSSLADSLGVAEDDYDAMLTTLAAKLPTSRESSSMWMSQAGRTSIKGQYLMGRLSEVDNKISYYENLLIQQGISRNLIADKAPLVIRESAPQQAEQKVARAALWGGVSVVWVLGFFVVFFWMRLAFDEYKHTFETQE